MGAKEFKYKAYIAGSQESKPFDHAYGKTAKSAIAAVKRANSPDWKDCYIYVVYLHDNGQQQQLTKGDY